MDLMNFQGYYDNEKIRIVRLSYQKSKTSKFAVNNLGIQIFARNYQVEGIDGKFTSDSIYYGERLGFGGSICINIGLNFNTKNFRLCFGIEPSVNFDFGNYYSFRKTAGNKGIIDNNEDFIKLKINIFPYVSIPVGDNSLINLQMNVRLTGFISPIIALKKDDCVFWVGYTP